MLLCYHRLVNKSIWNAKEKKRRSNQEWTNQQTVVAVHTHTHTHTYILTKEELAKIAKVCLSYSKIEYKGFEKVCKLNSNNQNETCKDDNNNKIKSKNNYEYIRIGVV